MAVIVEEQEDSPIISRNLQGVTFTHTYLIAWDDVDEFMLERIGQQYPSTKWSAFGLSVSIRPWGKMLNTSGDKTKNKWEKAETTVVYGTPSVNNLLYPKEDGAITERIAGNADTIQLSSDGFNWGIGEDQVGLTEDEAPFKLTTGLDYIYTIHNIEFAPLVVLNAISGVNHADILPIKGSPYQNLRFQRETLLFVKPTMSASVNSGGQSRITVEYQFSYRPNWDKPGTPQRKAMGWNAFWRPSANGGTGGYEYMYADGETDASKYYRNAPAFDFREMFGR